MLHIIFQRATILPLGLGNASEINGDSGIPEQLGASSKFPRLGAHRVFCCGLLDPLVGIAREQEDLRLDTAGLLERRGFAGLGVPDPDGSLISAGGKQLPVGRPGQGMHPLRMPLKRVQQFALGRVPEADRRTETDAFRLTRPYYAHTQQIDRERWQMFADFALKYGLIENAVDVKSIIWTKD